MSVNANLQNVLHDCGDDVCGHADAHDHDDCVCHFNWTFADHKHSKHSSTLGDFAKWKHVEEVIVYPLTHEVPFAPKSRSTGFHAANRLLP